jgi:hypothetical protein
MQFAAMTPQPKSVPLSEALPVAAIVFAQKREEPALILSDCASHVQSIGRLQQGGYNPLLLHSPNRHVLRFTKRYLEEGPPIHIKHIKAHKEVRNEEQRYNQGAHNTALQTARKSEAPPFEDLQFYWDQYPLMSNNRWKSDFNSALKDTPHTGVNYTRKYRDATHDRLIIPQDAQGDFRHRKWNMRAMSGTLPTRGSLFDRRVCDDPSCPFCQDPHESNEHFFNQCPAWSTLKKEIQSTASSTMRNILMKHYRYLGGASCEASWVTDKQIWWRSGIPMNMWFLGVVPREILYALTDIGVDTDLAIRAICKAGRRIRHRAEMMWDERVRIMNPNQPPTHTRS